MELDATALRSNLRSARESVGPTASLIPMVKADAYGLGMVPTAKALDATDPSIRPWGFGVAAIQEGVALRTHGYSGPIMMFAGTPPGETQTAVDHGVTLSIGSMEALGHLIAAAGVASAEAHTHGAPIPPAVAFQVEVDTAMGRAGFDWRLADVWGAAVSAAITAGAGAGLVRLDGAYTHFQGADAEDTSTAREQEGRFRAAVSALGPKPPGFMAHVCNSAGSFHVPDLAGSACRLGIFLYGGKVGTSVAEPAAVASVRARVIHVRDAPPGTTCGYGATYTATRHETWATLSLGYGDGLPRALSNKGSAIVNGQRVPIIGRVSMDVTVVDVTDVVGPVSGGDVATLIGTDGGATISVDEVAGLVGTISYEILTGITARVPRVWSEELPPFGGASSASKL